MRQYTETVNREPRRKKVKTPSTENPIQKKSTYIQVLEKMQANLKPMQTRNKDGKRRPSRESTLRSNDSMPTISAQEKQAQGTFTAIF